jgi:hypothetical protein
MMAETSADSENPYAAPQTELRPSTSGDPLTTAAHTKYLRQGIVAGLQMGGVGALITSVIYVAFWHEGSTVRSLFSILLVILSGCALVGFVIGFAVQLFAMLFGVKPTDSVLSSLASLPIPSLEPPEYSASQELDKTGRLPPPLC